MMQRVLCMVRNSVSDNEIQLMQYIVDGNDAFLKDMLIICVAR